MSGRKEKSLFPFQTDLIIHVAYLLSLCSCLSFLHVFWKRRLYPISDPVVCWFLKFFYYLMDIFFSCLCNCGGKELKTIWLPGEKGQNRYACVMNMILELSSPLILPQVIPWGWQLEREGQWGVFQIVQGFCRMALYSWIKLSHVSVAHPATCRARSFVYWKALEVYRPEVLLPFGWSPRLSLRKQKFNSWLPDGLRQISSSLSFIFPILKGR